MSGSLPVSNGVHPSGMDATANFRALCASASQATGGTLSKGNVGESTASTSSFSYAGVGSDLSRDLSNWGGLKALRI